MHQNSTAPEIWRAVVGYEGLYEISDHGRVRRVKADPRTYVGRILKPQRGGSKPGYWLVQLSNSPSRPRTRAIHLLMADAFMEPKPSPLHEINHRDGDSWNNLLTNLEWLTHTENVRHAFASGLAGDRRGAKNAHARLTEADVLAIRLTDAPIPEIAQRYGVGAATIINIRGLRTWKHVHAFQSSFVGDRRGERASKAKLTAADVREIRAMPADVPNTDIAPLYGVNAETIRAVRLRTSWRHID